MITPRDLQMRQLIVKQLDYDLTPVAGLSLVGHLLQPLRPVFKRIDAALPVVGGVPNSDCLAQLPGLAGARQERL